jgi:hypothetical protein
MHSLSSFQFRLQQGVPKIGTTPHASPVFRSCHRHCDTSRCAGRHCVLPMLPRVLLCIALTCAVALASTHYPPADVTSHTLSLFPPAVPGPALAPLPLWQPVSGSLVNPVGADGTSMGVHTFTSPVMDTPVDIHLTIVGGRASLAVSRCVLVKEPGSSSAIRVPAGCVTSPDAGNSEVFASSSLPITTASLP